MVIRWLRPAHSILIDFDIDYTDFESKIEEVRRHYDCVTLDSILKGLADGSPRGMAAIIIREARKGFFLRPLSFLLTENIPFTLFLRPDCIGLNRLPPEEELETYHQAYPQVLDRKQCQDWKERIWLEPNRVEIFLKEARARLGPLPIPTLDPLHFFATWGRVVEMPRNQLQLGLSLPSSPMGEYGLDDLLRFARTQVGREVTVASASRSLSFARKLLERAGIRAAIGPVRGVVDSKTDPFELPIWSLNEEQNKEATQPPQTIQN